MQKKCRHCGISQDISNFYSKGNKKGYWAYCRKCESIRKKQQLVNFKKQCLEYKNQFCCSICGYDKNITALDFHHTNQQNKDFNISKCRTYKLNNIIKQELDKCIVICSNCHREFHSLEEGIFTPKMLHPREQKYCIVCGKPCNYSSQKCINCYNSTRSTKRPPKEQLIQDLNEIKYVTRIGKKYGVTDNAVRKWCKYYKIQCGKTDSNRL